MADRRRGCALPARIQRANERRLGSGAFRASSAPGRDDRETRDGYGEQQKLEHSVASVWRETKQPLDEIHVRLPALI